MDLNYKNLGSGQPLIILHGLFGSLDNWMTLGRKFSEDFEVFLVDQRNHGKSPHTAEFNYEVMAEDLRDFISQHKIKNPIIIGHSMGGKTAMKFAVKYPDLLEKLIVVDIAPKSYPIHHGDIIKGLDAIDFSTITSRKDADDILADYVPSFPVRQFLLKNIYWKTDTQLAFRFNLAAIEKNIEVIGEGLNEKTIFEKDALFVGGKLSGYIKMPEDEQNIKQYFPNAEIKILQGIGHWIHAEAPNKFLNLVYEFTSKNKS